jgi:hypothetical protein
MSDGRSIVLVPLIHWIGVSRLRLTTVRPSGAPELSNFRSMSLLSTPTDKIQLNAQLPF